MEKYEHVIEIKDDACVGILISNTHNGSQWSSLSVKSITELEQLKDAIDSYLKGKRNP